MAQTVKIGRVKGSMWYTNLTDINLLEGDMWFDKNTSSIYQYKNNEWVKIDKLPTKVSELINDADYTTKEYVDEEIPTKLSQLRNDANYATRGELPTKVSDLENDANYVDKSLLGTSGGVATLDTNGRVLTSQLPSYVDDVIEFEKMVDGKQWKENALATANGSIVFNNTTASNLEGGKTNKYYRVLLQNVDGTETNLKIIKPEAGKIYVLKTSGVTFRWSGSNLVEISKSLALGETSSTAYAGNKGKANAEAITQLQNSKANSADLEKVETRVKTLEETLTNVGSGGSSTTETRTYDIVLTEKSWVRLAKVKDVTKNSSGRFKVMCYSLISSMNITNELTASIFNIGCGIVDGKVEVDVLPISQTPNLSNASGDGSGDTGSGGSGGVGSYGLNNITVEEFKGELYVCGFINFPNIELYDACRLEVSIDHNLNYEFMENVEVVDFTAVEYISQGASLIEGVNLVANEGYNFTIRTRLDNFNDCFVNGYSGNVSMSSDSDIQYSIPLLNIYEGRISLYDGSTDNPFLSDFTLDSLFNVDILTDELIIDGTNLDYETLSETIYRKICTLKGYHDRVDFGLVITGRIKYTSNSGDFQILLNGESVLSTGQSNYFDFTELDMRKDVLEVVGDGDEFNLELSVTLSHSYLDITLESIIPEKSFTIGYLDNDSPYNFSLFYDELNIHSKTDSYELVSMYNRIEELENNIIDIRQTYNTLDGRVIVHAYDSLNLDSSLEDLKWFLLDNGIPYSSMYLSSWGFTLDNFFFYPITDNHVQIRSILDNTKYLNVTTQMDMSTTTIRDIIRMHQPFVTEDKTLIVTKEKVIEDNFTTLTGKKIGFKKINSIEEFNNFGTITINFHDNNGNYFNAIRGEGAIMSSNPNYLTHYIQGRYKDDNAWTTIYEATTYTGIDIEYSGKSFETGSFDDYYLTFEEDNQELVNELSPVIEKYELANDIQKTDILKFNGNKIATEEFVEEKLGDIESILDQLNGVV